MSERTVEQICRDLLRCGFESGVLDIRPNLAGKTHPSQLSSDDVSVMANELSKILDEHIVRHAGVQPDLAQLRKDAVRYRKLRDVVETDPYDALVVTAGGNVELGSMLYSGDRLDAAVDALT